MTGRRALPVLLVAVGVAALLAASYFALPVYRCATLAPPPPGVVRGPCTLPWILYVVPLALGGVLAVAAGGWTHYANR